MAADKQDHYEPPTTHFVSKGCERCPDFHKRDGRKTIRNRSGRDEPNPNYGDCYKQICTNGDELVKGDVDKRDSDWREQGECKPKPCELFERRDRGVCRPDTCKFGEYNLERDSRNSRGK